MQINFSLEDAITRRSSVRNYGSEVVDEEIHQAIRSMLPTLFNPFGKAVKFYIIQKDVVQQTKKFGEYGVIKGAKYFLAASIRPEPLSLLALGYEFEMMVLYLTSLGLGTCWLGATFDRNRFMSASDMPDDHLMPIASPFGYAAKLPSFTETAMRFIVQAHKRKEWNQLFFDKNFATPFHASEESDLAFALEMVRLAPSASNKQPWRVVVEKGYCHFYEQKTPGYGNFFPYDIHRIDMGIAALHFDLAMQERGIPGEFVFDNGSVQLLPKDMEYVFSYKLGL